MKIEEYLKTLTPEEREQHKDLIKECLDRQKTIEESREKTDKALKRLDMTEQRFYRGLSNLAESLTTMRRELKNVYEQILKQKPKSLDETLKTLETDEFYKA